MVPSKLKLLFFIILSLQFSGILSKQNDDDGNGMSITLHMNNNHLQGYERVASMVQASKNRASALKRGLLYNNYHRKTGKSGKNISSVEYLYARSNLGEYLIKLSVGTPPQDLLLVMDTGSDVVWAPCTRNYTCTKCPKDYRVFLPSKSSSGRYVNCGDPKCKDMCGSGRCIHNCSGSGWGSCPDYEIYYGTGNTTGHLLTETITLALEHGRRREIKHFRVGCSVFSSVFVGIAGFGRGSLSMSSQLSPLIGDKFAYCLQSHLLYDDENKSSRMVLGDKAVPRDNPLNYTPFLNNSIAPSFPYSVFYYVGMEGVSIGRKRLKLPSKVLTFDSNGDGGTAIDSGSSFSQFPDTVYKQIVGEYSSQIGYRRSRNAEAVTGLGLCYNISGVRNIQFPEFVFHFKGGSDMVLPDDNCFMLVSTDILCLAMTNIGSLDGAVGPAVFIGNYQQQNFYILYDKEKNRLGFTQQSCKAFR